MAINVQQILSGIGQVILGTQNTTSVTQTPVTPTAPAQTGMSTGAIIGITAGVIVVIGGIVAVIIYTGKK